MTALMLLPGLARSAEPAPTPPGWHANVRYRFEAVDDAAFAKHANAHTARLRVGYAPKLPEGWEALVEAEGVVELNAAFNSGANRRTAYPAVADARALEINQAYFGGHNSHGSFKVGRQRITLDNQRFIGNSGWRQNEQTFDAISGTWQIATDTRAQAIWLGRVHRVAGDNAVDKLARERELDGRLFRLEQDLHAGGKWLGYGYWIRDLDLPAASSRTVGLRWTAAWKRTHGTWGMTAESAQQQGPATPATGTSRYLLLEPRLETAARTYRLGFERLGAGRGRAFQTPLATLHAFNGWADKFGVTPARGLEDRYASVQHRFGSSQRPATFELAWHDFKSDGGAVHYGSEWDASLGMRVRPGVQGLIKLADYQARGFARDTRKVWLQVEWVK